MTPFRFLFFFYASLFLGWALCQKASPTTNHLLRVCNGAILAQLSCLDASLILLGTKT